MDSSPIHRKFTFTKIEKGGVIHNKVWECRWENGTMTTIWGAIGTSPQQSTKRVPRNEAESIIRSKIRKGYKEVELHKVQPTVAPAHTSDVEPEVENLIQFLFKEAGEQIETYLAGTVDALSMTQINKGRALLDDIATAYRLDDRPTVRGLVQAYYNVIPTKLPRRKPMEEIVDEFVVSLSDQEERLDQLEGAIETANAQASGDNVTLYESLGIKMRPLPQSSNAYDRIAASIKKTRSYTTIHNIFQVHIPADREAWEAETRGKTHIESLFHGSKTANFRHILRQGLIIPKMWSNGWRFGAGVYFARDAIRSYNYAGSYSNNWRLLLVCDVALGRMKVLDGDHDHLRDAPTGFDSVHGIKSWSGYDEFIVYSESQQTARCLVICE